MARKIIRKREKTSESALSQYNAFCNTLSEGDVLYNKNISKRWGELFLVAAKMAIVINNAETFLLLLLGLDREEGKITPNGERIDITPQTAFFTTYLRPVGHCEYSLVPDIDKYKINRGLLILYKDTDLKKFAKTYSHKPRESKYGDDGNPLVKTTNNKQNEDQS